MSKLYQIYFYVPAEFANSVKEAMFQAGAGKIGAYDKCSWQVLGEGQFRPLQSANPFLGRVGEVEKVEEYRVEMVCEKEYLQDALNALKKSHPYEEVAYGVIELFNS